MDHESAMDLEAALAGSNVRYKIQVEISPIPVEGGPHGSSTSGAGDDGTNDLLVSQVIRTNELQIWFPAEHLVDVPLTRAE